MKYLLIYFRWCVVHLIIYKKLWLILDGLLPILSKEKIYV